MFDNGIDPFPGISRENITEKVSYAHRLLEGARSEDERMKLYELIVSNLDSRLSDPECMSHIIALADEALALDLPPPARIGILGHKASCIRKKYELTLGNSLRGPRKQIAECIFTAIKLGIDYRDALTKRIQDAEAANKQKYPGVEFNMFFSVKGMQSLPEWAKLLNRVDFGRMSDDMMEPETRKRELDNIVEDIKWKKGTIADVYARFPYDTDELRRLGMEILGDENLVNEIADRTMKEIAFRVEKMGGDPLAGVEDELELLPAATPASGDQTTTSTATPSSTSSPVSEPTAVASTHKAQPESSHRVTLLIGISTLGLLSAILLTRRARRAPSNH